MQFCDCLNAVQNNTGQPSRPATITALSHRLFAAANASSAVARTAGPRFVGMRASVPAARVGTAGDDQLPISGNERLVEKMTVADVERKLRVAGVSTNHPRRMIGTVARARLSI
jgi:hypothetical protein